MKISEQQLIVLMNVLYDSSSVTMTMGGLNRKERIELSNTLLKQQNRKLIEVDKDE